MSDEKQFNGEIYKKYSEVPEKLISNGFSDDSLIDYSITKRTWNFEKREQDESIAKLVLLLNLISYRKPVHLLDYGGGAGQVYYWVKKYFISLDSIYWKVIDKEEVVEKVLEKCKKVKNLDFFSDFQEIKKIDILFFRQSLQVIEDYKELLEKTSAKYKPKIIFISGVPAGENDDYLTLILLKGDAGIPCYIFNEEKLIYFLKNLGYDLLDSYSEGIKIKLNNFPETQYQLDAKCENYIKGYVFCRKDFVIW